MGVISLPNSAEYERNLRRELLRQQHPHLPIINFHRDAVEHIDWDGIPIAEVHRVGDLEEAEIVSHAPADDGFVVVDGERCNFFFTNSTIWNFTTLDKYKDKLLFKPKNIQRKVEQLLNEIELCGLTPTTEAGLLPAPFALLNQYVFKKIDVDMMMLRLSAARTFTPRFGDWQSPDGLWIKREAIAVECKRMKKAGFTRQAAPPDWVVIEGDDFTPLNHLRFPQELADHCYEQLEMIEKDRDITEIMEARMLENFKKNDKFFRKAKNLADLKDKHKGERVFIVGSGASLKDVNIELLKGKTVIAMNASAKYLKQHGIDPTYFMYCDWAGNIKEEPTENKAGFGFGDLDFSKTIGVFNFQSHPSIQSYKWKDHYLFCWPKSGGIDDVVKKKFPTAYPLMESLNVFIATIHFAYMLGAKEIVLLGVDHCRRADGQYHFDNKLLSSDSFKEKEAEGKDCKGNDVKVSLLWKISAKNALAMLWFYKHRGGGQAYNAGGGILWDKEIVPSVKLEDMV